MAKDGRRKNERVARRIAAFVLAAALSALAGGCGYVNSNISKVMDPAFGLKPTRSYTVNTEDGWTLSLTRINGAGKKSTRLPVVLCHGFGHNGFIWRVGGRRSFAQYLARKGYDVWMPDLRGAGASSKPGFAVMRTIIKSPFDWLDRMPYIVSDFTKVNWTVDDHIRYDLPAILKLVKKETGADAVNWVGHSMGGMVALAYMEDMGKDRGEINSIIALAAPMTIAHPLNDIMTVLRENKDLFQILNLFVNQSIPSMLNAATGANLQNGLDYLYFNSANMDRLTVMELLFYVVEDISPGCVDQFMTMVRDGSFKSADRSIDYSNRLGRVEIPVFAAAGKADNLAEPETIRYVYRHISSKDKAFKVFGISSGAQMDYGHTDLLLGKRSHLEVFPVLEEWLRRHATRPPPKPAATRPARNPQPQ